ncbi:erythroblast NAD(P)(+)--arginine ADP-ribosyltransferase-like isoform X2 [Haemorhous mexicanus]|uniref:erythroblast NAD(P)(+)--arginine ADP-ribosyltransferase-like isoform X2 n=1 Tax=Haemorhous mexicanus TaxID=30427 RepID=UPI0028BE7527|nr:erythroblast NAD(P)(+)--arginine ADP-ribosyltransferase-like isoform X2 [Haemorhous mexicanus]
MDFLSYHANMGSGLSRTIKGFPGGGGAMQIIASVPHWSMWPLHSMALLAQTLALLAMTVATVAIKVVPLDMAQDSFDDQYRGCGPAMTAALPALNHSEFEQNPLFAQAWEKATAEWQSRGSPVSPLSSPAQAIALMAYTMEDVYKKFNDAVRVAGSSSQEYRDNFHFKTLHFLLTDALATLRDTREPQCHNVYWGVRGVRFKAEQGDIVRFGQFTSVSLNGTTANDFGIDTVFHVHTCHGVGIWEFSNYPGKKEVLISPFETFEVIGVSQEGDRARIQLLSTGIFSNYNCEWLRGGSVPRAPFHLSGLLLATTALAVATGIL